MDFGKILYTSLITLLLSLGSLNASAVRFGRQPVVSILPAPQVRALSNPVPVTNPISADVSQGMSSNWSGYGAVGGNFTSVSGTWTVPTPQPDGNFAADATWVGIGGITTTDLIQAGTQATTSLGGRVDYQAFYEMLPGSSRPIPLDVQGGDLVTVTISRLSGEQWQILFRDNSTGRESQFTVNYNSSLSSADWVEEAPSGMRRLMPLDNFGSVTFTNAWAVKDGQKTNPANLGAHAILMGLPGQTLATPSGLGNDGASFTVTRTIGQIQTGVYRSTYRQVVPDFDNY